MTETETGSRIVLGRNNYGKSENRIVKVNRDTKRHELWDLDVRVAGGDGDRVAGAHVRIQPPRRRHHSLAASRSGPPRSPRRGDGGGGGQGERGGVRTPAPHRPAGARP